MDLIKTVQECSKVVPNRFKLITIASHYAKDISSRTAAEVASSFKSGIIALQDIASGNADCEVISENIITSYRAKYGKSEYNAESTYGKNYLKSKDNEQGEDSESVYDELDIEGMMKMADKNDSSSKEES